MGRQRSGRTPRIPAREIEHAEFMGYAIAVLLTLRRRAEKSQWPVVEAILAETAREVMIFSNDKVSRHARSKMLMTVSSVANILIKLEAMNKSEQQKALEKLKEIVEEEIGH